MTTPDKTQASGAQDQDQAEAREPGARGWFQPLGRPPAADPQAEGGDQEDTAGSPHTDVSDPVAEAGDPDATAVFPRLQVIEAQAEVGEPPAQDQASVSRAAERPGDDELPTAIQASLAGTDAPEHPARDRPADITRPQLILDDTVVDMTGLRGGWNPGQTRATGAAS